MTLGDARRRCDTGPRGHARVLALVVVWFAFALGTGVLSVYMTHDAPAPPAALKRISIQSAPVTIAVPAPSAQPTPPAPEPVPAPAAVAEPEPELATQREEAARQPRRPRPTPAVRETTPEIEPSELPSVGSALTECLQVPSYSRCIIQRIPQPRSAREIRSVIEAYRDLRDDANACRWMRTYLQRYGASDAHARQYSQHLQATCS